MKRLLILTILALGCMSLRAEQFADSVRVHFRVNKIKIDTLLMGNDAAMISFVKRMSDMSDSSDRSDCKVKINSILITGAASPEGSIPYNRWLSERRAGAITRWLGTYFEFPDSVAHFVFKGRDWQGLLRLVEEDTAVPYRDEVLALLKDIANPPLSDSYANDGVKRLKALRGGVPYRYLFRKHFPGLRASEVFITGEVEKVVELDQLVKLDQLDLLVQAPDTLIFPPLSFLPRPERSERGYFFGVRSNLLYDAALVPNLGLEFPIGSHLSAGANWMYAWWKNHDRNRHWRIYGGDAFARYYFGAGLKPALQGHHVGLYAQVLLFQIAFGGRGYITGIPGQDIWGKPWYGGGAEYGYSMRIAGRLNLDFTLGVGYACGEYQVYRPIGECYVWQSTHRVRWFGPTKAEISLVWLIGRMERRHPASEIQKGGGE